MPSVEAAAAAATPSQFPSAWSDVASPSSTNGTNPNVRGRFCLWRIPHGFPVLPPADLRICAIEHDSDVLLPLDLSAGDVRFSWMSDPRCPVICSMHVMRQLAPRSLCAWSWRFDSSCTLLVRLHMSSVHQAAVSGLAAPSLPPSSSGPLLCLAASIKDAPTGSISNVPPLDPFAAMSRCQLLRTCQEQAASIVRLQQQLAGATPATVFGGELKKKRITPIPCTSTSPSDNVFQPAVGTSGTFECFFANDDLHGWVRLVGRI